MKEKASQRWKVLLAVILTLVGVSLVSYPFVASYLNRFAQSSAIDGYLSDAYSESAQEMNEQIQEAIDYNRRLLNASAVMSDPFSEEAFLAALDRYDEILAVNATGIMGYLDIPSINVHLPIYHGTGSYALQHGVGHLQSTSFPVGGESTHAVLSAHSGLTNSDMFDDLPDVRLGDLFSVTVLTQTLWYEAYEREVILPEDTASLSIQPGEDLVTLLTCTPYGINSHRFLVHGRRTDAPTSDVEDAPVQQEQSATVENRLTMRDKLLLAAVSGCALILMITILVIRRKKQTDDRK